MPGQGQHGALRAVVERFHPVGFVEHGEHASIDSGGGLDDVGHLPGLAVRVLDRKAGVGVRVRFHARGQGQALLILAVGAQVEVRTVGHPLELLEAVGEAIHDVRGGLGVMGQLIRFHHQQL